MTQNQRNLEIALEELELTKQIKNQLKSQVKRLKSEIYQLKNPVTIKSESTLNIERILKESSKAMDKFSEKLRKENAKNAKQKQSKG